MPLGGWGKRAFDLGFGLAIFLPGLPIFLTVAALVWLKDGRPVFHLSRRMRSPGRAFWLIKFRTMAADVGDLDNTVLGGDKAGRITALGAKLRRARLDEAPQLLNVLWGDMSFIGPRPPPRRYVDMFPELYAKVLRSKPGITGLATIMFHTHEEWLLSGVTDPAEVERIYTTRCIPRKARLDLLYQRRASVSLDAYLLWLTASKLFPLPGRRIERMKKRDLQMQMAGSTVSRQSS
jgi:lipopolysaccharide/colanic/teichoic acid biosynthesis glycosyltransferase